jgi:hypothetical protein
MRVGVSAERWDFSRGDGGDRLGRRHGCMAVCLRAWPPLREETGQSTRRSITWVLCQNQAGVTWVSVGSLG